MFYSNDILEDLKLTLISMTSNLYFYTRFITTNPFCYTTQNKEIFCALRSVPPNHEKSGIKTGVPWDCKF